MLVGAYPFEDPDDPKNIRKTIQVNAIRTAIDILLYPVSAIFFFNITLHPHSSHSSSAANNASAIQDSRLCPHIYGMPATSCPYLCCQSNEGNDLNL